MFYLDFLRMEDSLSGRSEGPLRRGKRGARIYKNQIVEFPGGQWLGLRAFTAEAGVQSLVVEVRSRKPRGVAKTKQNQVVGTLENYRLLKKTKYFVLMNLALF